MKFKKIISVFTSAVIAVVCTAGTTSLSIYADDAVAKKNTDLSLRLDAEKTYFTLDEIKSGNAKTTAALYADNFNDDEKITVIMAGFGVSNDGIKISNIRFPNYMGLITEDKKDFKDDEEFAPSYMRFDVASDDETCNFYIKCGSKDDPIVADDLSRPIVEFDVSFAASMTSGKYEINFDNATTNWLYKEKPDMYTPTEIIVQSEYDVDSETLITSYSESARKNTKPLEITIETIPGTETTLPTEITTTVTEQTTVLTTAATSETTGTVQIKGDISGNGKIDLYDAIEIAKSLIGIRKFTEEEQKIADFNGDGKVDLYDAIAIAKYMLKK